MSCTEVLTENHFENFFRVVMHKAEIIAFDKSQGRAADLSNWVINTFNFKFSTLTEFLEKQ